MDGPDPIIDLGLDCPSNGTFYICKDSPIRFIGCCTSNPCGDRKGLCPDEHLEPATYEARYRIPPQDCVNDNFAVSWYTCPKTKPPFLGCCAVDPCSRGGCPDRELRAAKLSDKKNDADLFVGGKSPGSDSKGNPSSKLSITTATLTASYISTKTIEAGIDATSTLDSTPPSGQPLKGMSNNAKLGVGLTIAFVVSFIFGVAFTYLYWRYKHGRRVNTAGNNQSSSRWSSSPSTNSSSRNGRLSIHGSIYAIRNSQGRINGIEGPSRIAFEQDPGQEIHTRASSEEQHHQQSQDRCTQQQQPGHDTGSPIPRISVEAPSQVQNSTLNPSTPQPPYPTSDLQNGSDQASIAQAGHPDHLPWVPSVKLLGNTETSHSTGPPSTHAPMAELLANTQVPPSTGPPGAPVNNPSSPIFELLGDTEMPLPRAPPRTPVDKSSSPITELPANTETPLSTNPPSAPKHRLSDDTVCREPAPKRPKFPRRRPINRPSTVLLSDIPEEQSVEDLNSSNTAATGVDGQVNHDQSGSGDKHQCVTGLGENSRRREDYSGDGYPKPSWMSQYATAW